MLLQMDEVEKTLVTSGQSARNQRHPIIYYVKLQYGRSIRVETIKLLECLEVIEKMALPLYLSPLLHAERTKIRSQETKESVHV